MYCNIEKVYNKNSEIQKKDKKNMDLFSPYIVPTDNCGHDLTY